MSDEPVERLFTLDEANDALPRLREALTTIREARQEVMASGERIRRAAVSDGGGPEGARYLDSLKVLREESEALAGEGIILRDPETGLVDFPAEREGRQVFLCWRLGEDAVGFWHEADTGFSGRQPL